MCGQLEIVKLSIYAVPMKRFLYPTPAQTEIPLVWSAYGADALDHHYEGRRAETRVHLHELVRRLGLGPGYTAMSRHVARRRLAVLDPELLKALVTVLRYHGYIHRDPGTDHWRATPLTGVQLHAVRLYASGLDQGQIAATLRVNRSSVSARMIRIMRATDSRTVPQALIRVYDLGWLPDRDERDLLARRKVGGFPYLIQEED